MSSAETQAFWTDGKKGSLAPWQQAKVWAINWVMETYGEKSKFKVLHKDIALAVTKVGGGHPERPAVSQLLEAMKNDPDWYPGKAAQNTEKRGAKRTFTAQRQQAVANSAMALKRSGEEPSAADVKQRCPAATLNPNTGEPYTDKYIYEVFESKCHDDGAEVLWSQMNPLNKTALSEAMQVMRAAWGRAQLRLLEQTAGWWFRHVIYADPCHTILSNKVRTTFDEKQASYGKGKRWMSADAQRDSRNCKASPYATKQCQFGDRKIWWMIVMVRGHVHFEILGDRWVQCGAGMADFVGRLEGICKQYLDSDEALPRIVFSDRGPGFYQSSTGHIVREYWEALNLHGFRPYAGTDASLQPADMPDVFPHETAVAWARNFFKKHPIQKEDLDDMERALRARFKECAKFINKNYDVEGLHKQFPTRFQELIDRQGDRLTHH
jgi:hypothetical protein